MALFRNRHFTRSAAERWARALRLRPEPLEDRLLLAAVTVNTPLDTLDFDDGYTSLREAIIATNIVPGADEIVFDFYGDGPQRIVLTQGELRITDSLTITGPGADLLKIDASGSDPTPHQARGDGSRAFDIAFGGYRGDHRTPLEVAFRDLTVTGGDAPGDGGGIRTTESLTLDRVTVVNNTSADRGGGVYVYGRYVPVTIEIINSTIAHNESLSVRAHGGGFYASVEAGSVQIQNSQFLGNHAAGSWAYGGGMYIAVNGDVTVEGNVISNNSSIGTWGYGGGAYVEVSGAGATSITGNHFRNNLAEGQWSRGAGLFLEAGGAGIVINENSIAGNRALGFPAYGGGVAIIASADHVDVAMRQNRIVDNEAAMGGGLYLEARNQVGTRLSVVGSEISHNTGRSHGGGAYFEGNYGTSTAVWTINNSAITANTAGSGDGGGIYASSRLEIANVTLSGNQAAGRGGGILAFGAASIDSATITNNSASYGGGVQSEGFDAVLTLTSSIVAGNRAASAGPDVRPHYSSIIASNSLIGDNSGSDLAEAPAEAPDSRGNMIGGVMQGIIDPRLAPLAHNGGRTMTHALLPGSPAIDRGNSTAPSDQRGFAAPVDHPGIDNAPSGHARDMGAFELQNVAAADFDDDGQVDGRDFLLWQRGRSSPRQSEALSAALLNGDDLKSWKALFGANDGVYAKSEPPSTQAVTLPLVIDSSVNESDRAAPYGYIPDAVLSENGAPGAGSFQPAAAPHAWDAVSTPFALLRPEAENEDAASRRTQPHHEWRHALDEALVAIFPE